MEGGEKQVGEGKVRVKAEEGLGLGCNSWGGPLVFQPKLPLDQDVCGTLREKRMLE